MSAANSDNEIEVLEDLGFNPDELDDDFAGFDDDEEDDDEEEEEE